MKKFLLDTNVVSELRKHRPHGAVLAWLRALREEEIFISVVTMGELQSGIEMTRRQDPQKAAEIESWVDVVEASYRILPMDSACFRECGRLMDGKSDRLFGDAMIAATARLHSLTVATRNESDFKQMNVLVVNPFR